jgi:hypothetical protein
LGISFVGYGHHVNQEQTEINNVEIGLKLPLRQGKAEW